MRARAQRKKAPGVVHPDLCPKLEFYRVEFAMPPMGLEVRPVFVKGRCEVQESGGLDWPEITEFRKALAGRREEKGACPTCGQSLGGEYELATPVLQAAFALVARALRVQYDLSDSDLAELLAFGGEVPLWFRQLANRSFGLDPTGTGHIDLQAVGEFVDGAEGDVAEVETETEAQTEEPGGFADLEAELDGT